jgi:hypothetical protein
MKFYVKLFLLSLFALMATSCSKVVPPHTAIKCKLNYDSCMIANTLKGPLRSHEICLAERAPVCHDML